MNSLRLLWVKVGGLWPVNAGGRLRSMRTIAELAKRHRITLMTTHGPGDDVRGLEAALPDCEVVSFPHRIAKRGSVSFAKALAASYLSPLPVDLWRCQVPSLQREIERRLAGGAVDLCVADFLAAFPNMPKGGSVPLVLFEHNVEHQIWQRLCATETSTPKKLLLEIEWRKLRRYEAAAVARAHRTLVVSENDRALLGSVVPGAEVRAVPTGVDVEYFAPTDTPERDGSLVFCGSMDWYPNEQGITWFMAEVLPRVRKALPSASLTIVGRAPSMRLRQLAADAGAMVTGTVDDVRPHLASAAVAVVPLHVGGGTRLKIFEALAMGKAVVSTRIGAEGLPVKDGEHIVLADDPEGLAQRCVELLSDPGRRRALGNAGRQLVCERHSWEVAVRHFEHECAEVMRCA
jgi:polysaccharide biosynthesis protein PslH